MTRSVLSINLMKETHYSQNSQVLYLRPSIRI